MMDRIEQKFILKKNVDTVNAEQLFLQLNFIQTRYYHIYSLYFDDDKCTSFTSHVEGNSTRQKFRLRFYTDIYGNVIHKVFAEIKKKHGRYGQKERIELPYCPKNPIVIKNNTEAYSFFKKIVSNSNFKFFSDTMLKPSAITSCARKRYSAQSGSTELNIDTNIVCCRVHGNIVSLPLPSLFTVIESKRSVGQVQESNFTNNIFHKILDIATPKSFSKYLHSFNVYSLHGR